MLVPFSSSSENMDSEILGCQFLHRCLFFFGKQFLRRRYITDHMQEKGLEKMEESFQLEAYQEHGIHQKDAQKFEVEEVNDGFRTPHSMKHRIHTNPKTPPAPMKHRRVPMKKKKKKKFEVEEDNDGFRTPHSMKHRIHANPKTPPAPMKPRRVPMKKTKKLTKVCGWVSQEHGIHQKDAQKFEVGFRTPPSMKHRIPSNPKTPQVPMKPRRVPMKKKKLTESVGMGITRWNQCFDQFLARPSF